MTKELSDNPRRIKRRLRDAAANGSPGSKKRKARDLAMLEEKTAHKPVSQWDLEELAKGKPRNKAGGFSGPAPRWITADVEAERKRRLQELARQKLDSLVYPALTRFAQLLDSADERVQVQVTTYIFDQLFGKAPVRVALDGKVNVETMLAAALVVPGGEQAHPTLRPGEIIEGELADDDEDDLFDDAPAPRRERPSTPKQVRTDARDPEEDARYHAQAVREHRQRQYGDGLDDGPDPAPPGYSRFQAWENGEDL